jgi:hypothetical protein
MVINASEAIKEVTKAFLWLSGVIPNALSTGSVQHYPPTTQIYISCSTGCRKQSKNSYQKLMVKRCDSERFNASISAFLALKCYKSLSCINNVLDDV